MANRLEMVVRGQRQTALTNTPDFTSGTSPADGFFMEGTRLSSMELPDHWIPFYGVGLQIVQGTGKRSFFQDGRRHEDAFQTDDMFVIAPQELRQYRLEVVEAKLSMVSIEPVVLQDLVAGSSSRSPFELTRSWRGPDPVLKNLILKLEAEVTTGYPAGPLLGEALCTKIAEEIIQRYSIGRPAWTDTPGGFRGPNCGERWITLIRTSI